MYVSCHCDWKHLYISLQTFFINVDYTCTGKEWINEEMYLNNLICSWTWHKRSIVSLIQFFWTNDILIWDLLWSYTFHCTMGMYAYHSFINICSINNKKLKKSLKKRKNINLVQPALQCNWSFWFLFVWIVFSIFIATRPVLKVHSALHVCVHFVYVRIHVMMYTIQIIITYTKRLLTNYAPLADSRSSQ